MVHNVEGFPFLSQPIALGSMRLRNRVVMLPHGLVYAERSAARITNRHVKYYAARARGGVGLIVLESAFVSRSGEHRIPLVYPKDPRCVPGYARLVDAIHKEGAAVCAQLTHYGNGADQSITRQPLLGPSNLPAPWKREPAKPMTRGEMQDVMEDFVISARHIAEAGFDGVELKAGLDGLLRQFLSPLTNERLDEYGGTPENRVRYLLEVASAVRQVIGSGVALGVRLTLDECYAGGYGIDDGVRFAKALEESGVVDYISASVGIIESLDLGIAPMSVEEGYAEDLVARTTQSVKLPVIAVGRITRPEHAEEILAQGKAAAIGMARGLIAEPDWVRKAFAGTPWRVRPCTGCNQLCVGNLDAKIPISCTVNPYAGFGERPPRYRRRPEPVVVIGGGPGGMEAARTAAEAGYRITIFERNRELGGQLLIAGIPRGRSGWRPYLDWIRRELRELAVDVRLGVEPGIDELVALDPCAVVLATGSVPGACPLVGAVPIDTFLAERLRARRVVLVDYGSAGIALWTSALEAAERGAEEVTVVTELPVVGSDVDSSTVIALYRDMHQRRIRLMRDHRALERVGDTLHVENVHNGVGATVEADLVVFSAPRTPVVPAFAPEIGSTTRVVRIGDAEVARDVAAAIRDGQSICSRLTDRNAKRRASAAVASPAGINAARGDPTLTLA